MWRQMKDWLAKGAIPDEEQFALQICLPGYHINRSNKLVLESKSDLAQRGEASPDNADALALTFAPARIADRGASGRIQGIRDLCRFSAVSAGAGCADLQPSTAGLNIRETEQRVRPVESHCSNQGRQ
jgi:hypothetical protein